MTIWDGLAKPENNALTMRLAHKSEQATWSWIRQSDKKVGIAVEIEGDFFNTVELPSSKNLEVNVKRYVGLEPMLAIVCLNSEFFDIFEVLCNDLIKVCSNHNDKSSVLNAIKKRILIWHELFKRDFRGLSKKEIIGLAAELEALKLWLAIPNNTLSDWVGPEGAPQDLVTKCGSKALEVKVTSWNSSTITISSLYQLDFSGELYLVVYPTRISSQEEPSAKNLNTLIEELYVQFPQINSSLFESKLLEVGYLKDACSSVYFEISQPMFYKIDVGFPRLTKATIPDPIDSCSYSLQLSKLDLFKVVEMA
jgi:hypothetical protein